MKVLVLGGTGEARALASALVAAGVPVVSSLAGRLADPRLPAGEVRVGGFGGAEGLAVHLTDGAFTAVVDATHPFAAGITANAAAAGAATGVPLLILERPPWEPVGGDEWIDVPSLAAAAAAVEARGARRVLLTTGRQGAGAFAGLDRARCWLRAIEAPAPPLPRHCTLILARGPFDLDAERNLLRENRIDLVVTKNSGGPLTAAKLTAAREAGIPVVMVRRPPRPPGVPAVPDATAAAAWLAARG